MNSDDCPEIIKELMTKYDAWVVGEAAHPFVEFEDIEEYCIVMTQEQYLAADAADLFPSTAVSNEYLGVDFKEGSFNIEIIPKDFEVFIKEDGIYAAYHYNTGTELSDDCW